MHSSVSPPAIHGERRCPKSSEPSSVEMLPRLHRANDACEGDKLLLLTADQWLRFEERDDPSHQVMPPAHDVHQCGVPCTAMVLPDPSAAETIPDEVQDLSP